MLVEVPLEDNRSASRPAKRAEAERIGHLHAFDRAQVHALLAECGLTPLAELSDPLPYAHHVFWSSPAPAAAKWAVRTALWRAAPRRAEKLFTVHYAVIAR